MIPRKVNALDAIFCQPLTPSVLKFGNKSAHSDLELEISLESVELKSMFLGQKREMHTNGIMLRALVLLNSIPRQQRRPMEGRLARRNAVRRRLRQGRLPAPA